MTFFSTFTYDDNMMNEGKQMTNQEIAKSIRHNLFAERDNLKEAFDYAFKTFRTLGANELAATTALFVVLNTLANELEKSEKTV